jgi:cysteinyl-tRNA synthetase
MPIQFYNTLNRSLQEFVPARPEEVTFYSCGPTVYNFAHIGNMRANISYDLIRRYLEYRGYAVKHVMNITDVDDKTIRDSQAAGQSLTEFTEYYTAEFLEDLKTLKIGIPEIMPRATAEIDEMVELIESLIDKGNAYQTEKGDVYFKISTFPSYGELAKIDLDQLRSNAEGRLNLSDEYDKEDVQDFALWKAYDEGDGDVYWETSIGKGRPGWHTECSVMAHKYLGMPIDIHAGGIDLCFPHHTNEIAQSECCYGGKFVNYWLHNEHVIVDGRKMSKSEGNFYTLRDLLEKGLSARAIRYELLKTHYRQQLDFRISSMEQNQNVLNRFSGFVERLREPKTGSGWAETNSTVTAAKAKFCEAMDNDLNVAEGLAVIFDFMNSVNRCFEQLSEEDAQKVLHVMEGFEQVFGFVMPEAVEDLAEEVERLIEERTAARKEKNFARADEIRDELLSRGIELEDTPSGIRWKKI